MGRGRRHAGGRVRTGDTLIPLGDGDRRRQPAPVAAGPVEVLKLPQEWAREDGIFIIDPDGWRHPDGPSFDEPCNHSEYQKRVMSCTQMPLADAQRKGWVG